MRRLVGLSQFSEVLPSIYKHEAWVSRWLHGVSLCFSDSPLISVAAWNSSIRQAVNHGDACKALLIFCQMILQSHVQPNNFTFPFIAKACGKLSDIKLSRMVHAHVVKTPYCLDTYVQTAFIDMYGKCCHLECAYQVFDEMSVRDVVSWNTMVVGFAQLGFFDRACLLFRRMRGEGISPDVCTVMGLTQLVSKMKDRKLLSVAHCFGVKYGFEEDVSIANTWIAGYAKCNDLCSAEKVFCGIDLNSLNVVSWNAMIAGCAYFEEWLKAVEVYHQMLRDGYSPDLGTIVNLISSFAHPSSLHNGMLVHAHGVKVGCDTHTVSCNTLISMYSKCGDIRSARCIFDHTNERSCVTWNAMIGGYSEKGDLDEALSLFHKMDAAGEKPDLVTVVHLIAASGKVGALEVGKWIDDYTISKGLKNEVMVRNALLDMYVKCGSLEQAENLFRLMSKKTVVSWTTLISGFSLNGRSQEALDHFDQMLELGVKPNRVTFLSVLQACTHAGLIKKGWEIFDMMTKKYHIKPGLDHYACMTDLLGRGGQLREALEFIEEMPIEADAGIWGALLSACKIHGNFEIGKVAAGHLFRIEPHAAAPYVEMANLYALAQDWDGAADTRMKMRVNQITKNPGQSVVQVGGKWCSFMVEDRLHSQRGRMFETLDNLLCN